jgi:hypothetical protein
MGRPQTFLALNGFDLLELRERHDETTCTWSDYIASAVPRVSGGNKGTTLVHEVALPLLCGDLTCLHSNDQSPIHSRDTVIETSWPQILQITPDTGGGHGRLPNSHGISFPAQEGLVEYALVGTTSYRRRHWTSKIRIADQTFSYDDLNNGCLRLLQPDDTDVCSDDPGFDTVLLTYHRTSHASVVNLLSPRSQLNIATHTLFVFFSSRPPAN